MPVPSTIYPQPQEINPRPGAFRLTENVVILVPTNPSADDRFLARFLAAELVDRYQVAVRTERAGAVPAGKTSIVMGTAANALVQALGVRRGVRVAADDPRAEGYGLDVAEDGILIAGGDRAGALYGIQSLRQLIQSTAEGLVVPGVRVRDWPRKPFRGLRLYLPGKDDLPFFKRFIRDFALLFKYNTLIIEVNAAMRFDRHPELNAGWYELAKCLNYTRRDRPEGPHRQFQDSSHQDTGDFGLVEKDEIAELVRYARAHGFDVIPEIPSLTHSYYLLTRHRELAEIQKAEWPDTYCPCLPQVYKLYFDVLDEYIEVIQPRIVHIGHDEWRMPVHVCPRCKDQDYRDLFVRDVVKIHDYLKAKGIRTAMWGDHFLESVRGVELADRTGRSGFAYKIPGGVTPAQVARDVPKDILIFNWFWNNGAERRGEANENQMEAWGFEQLYGNFTPAFLEQDWGRRSARPSILGGAASSWARTDEYNFGKDLMRDFIGCAGMLWASVWPDASELAETVQAFMPMVRTCFNAHPLPSVDGEPLATLDMRSLLTSVAGTIGLGAEFAELRAGETAAGPRRFVLTGGRALVGVAVKGIERLEDKNGETKEFPAFALAAASAAIPVNEDASSLLFLHACARPAHSFQGHFSIYNFPDTADLLGWYEVTYEDGFVATIPVRFGVNILPWDWARMPSRRWCYQADPVNCAIDGAPPVTFFAYEWRNPRFGKVITQVRLCGSRDFVNLRGEPTPNNALLLAAVSLVKKRKGPASEYMGEEL